MCGYSVLSSSYIHKMVVRITHGRLVRDPSLFRSMEKRQQTEQSPVRKNKCRSSRSISSCIFPKTEIYSGKRIQLLHEVNSGTTLSKNIARDCRPELDPYTLIDGKQPKPRRQEVRPKRCLSRARRKPAISTVPRLITFPIPQLSDLR